MGSSTLITDYLGYGTVAARPVAPSLPAGCLGVYYATDTGQIQVWDGAWREWAPSAVSFSGGLVAAGSGQGTATAVSSDVNLFTTVTSGTGAVLVAGLVGTWRKVLNRGGAVLLVYPPVGSAIDALAAGEAVAIVPGEGATFWQSSAMQWYSE